MGTAYRHLGLVAKAQGNLEEAQSFLHKSLATFGDYIIGWDISQTLVLLGETIALTGNCSKAREILLTALRLAHDIHSAPLMLEAVTALASLDARLAPDRTAGWLRVVSTHPAAPQEMKDRACQLLRTVEGYLSADQIHAIRNRKSTETLESVVDALVLD
jgi:tetratricopeptide (TPR) repeat protein